MLKKLSEFLKKNKYVFIFALFIGLAAGLFSWYESQGYRASMSFFINRLGTQAASDYKYDNYYALQAVNDFSGNFAGWFKNPEIVAAIFKKAGVNFSPNRLADFSGVFTTSKTPANLLEIQFSADSAAQAKKIAQAMDYVAQEKVQLLTATSWQGVAFTVSGGEPIIIKNTFTVWLNVLAGFLVGLAAGFFIKIAKDYL